MSNYRLTKVSDSCYRIQRGRETIGWCRMWEGGAWEAKTGGGRGAGPTAVEAFRSLVRELNNAAARKAGFSSVREMVDKHNEKVRKEAAEFNNLMSDALGPLAPLMQVRLRRGRRILG